MKRYEQLVEELVKTKMALVQKIDELGKTRTRLRREEDERTETVLFGHNDADLSDVPEYPKEKPNTGKYWELVYREGVLSWEEKDRPLTAEERLELVEAEVDAIKHEWKVGETVNVCDRRYYMGSWYTCLQAHTTQADWTPDIVPALWRKE